MELPGYKIISFEPYDPVKKERQRILKLIDETDSIPCPFCGGENSDCTTCHGTDHVRVFNYGVLKQKIEEKKK